MKNNAMELFPIIDEQGHTIGKATRKECHDGSKLLHPVIHLQIFNEQGALYLQKRAMDKDIQPGKWDTAVGGHIDYGEEVRDALFREAREELGIKDFSPIFSFSYIFESEIEKEMVYSYRTVYNGAIIPDRDEVETGRFLDNKEIEQNIGEGKFKPNI